MIDTWLSWAFLLAIGQAGFLVMALPGARQPELRTANRLLSALLVACAVVIFHAWLGIKGLNATWPHSANAVATLGLLFGPLLYLYLRALLFDQPLGRRALIHLLPFALATLALTPFYLQSGAEKLAWMQGRRAVPWYLGLAALAKLMFFLCYVFAGFRQVQKARDSVLAPGLRRLMKVWLLGGAASVAALGIEFAELALPISADAIGAIALLLFVYATAFLAVRLPLGYRPAPEPVAAPKVRYANSTMSENEKSGFMTSLAASMEQEHAWRNGELKLEELAAMTAMTPHELSQLINEECGTNFQDYLNRYRVEALKLALHAPDHLGASILDLGVACGFNSKSALNRIFKAHTGMTPSEFRKSGTSQIMI